MKILKSATALIVLALLSVSVSAFAQPPNFDYLGYAKVPANIGGTLEMCSFMTNNGVVPTPIPFNWVGEEHTVVITGTLSAINVFGSVTQYEYNAVTVEIYSDVGPTTAADYAIKSTFMDNPAVPILSGVCQAPLLRTPNPFGTSGSISCFVDWTGGSRLGELGANTTGWGMGGVMETSVGSIPAGYDELWDCKIDQALIAVEDRTWGEIKSLYVR